jgi:hypothetical protein
MLNRAVKLLTIDATVIAKCLNEGELGGKVDPVLN